MKSVLIASLCSSGRGGSTCLALFMTYDERATYLISMRDKVRGQKASELQVQMNELVVSSVPYKSWDRLINQSGLLDFMNDRVLKLKEKPLNYNTTKVSGIITFLRDTYEHVNDNYTMDAANGRFYTPEDFAKCTDVVAPGLLPSYFEHHGSLRARYEK